MFKSMGSRLPSRSSLITVICLITLLLTVVAPAPATANATAPTWEYPLPDITASGAVLMDADTGQILYGKQLDETFYPASTTKIMTALVALQHVSLDEQTTVSLTAVDVEGSLAYFEPGERLSMQDVLYGLMLMSGNDAALVIAEHVGGSVTEFARLMNEQAAALGLTGSHFVNPHGLHDPDHYTTPRDLAILARHALQNETFAQIVATEEYTLQTVRTPREIFNNNRLLWSLEGATGVKTGYTPEANSTFVGSAKRDGRHLLAVVMDTGTEEKWTDAAALLEYGFAAFVPWPVVAAGDTAGQVTIAGGTAEAVPAMARSHVSVLVGREGTEPSPYVLRPSDLEVKQEVTEQLAAPVTAGTAVGTASVLAAGQMLGQTDLIAAEAVPALPEEPATAGWSSWWWYTPLLVYAIWRTHVGFRRLRRAKAKRLLGRGPGQSIQVHRLLRGHGD